MCGSDQDTLVGGGGVKLPHSVNGETRLEALAGAPSSDVLF